MSHHIQYWLIFILFAPLLCQCETVKFNAVVAQLEEYTVYLNDEVTIEFIRVPAGTFRMGLNEPTDSAWHTCAWGAGGETVCNQPVHQVHINYDFYLGKYELTQQQWQAVMGENPNGESDMRSEYPVDSVSWVDCQLLIAQLNEKYNGTFRLPSEAEWEYAARAGANTRFFFGDSSCSAVSSECAELSKYAWWYGKDSSGSLPRLGGQLQPNPWGFYDIYGNVFEWCADDFDISAYTKNSNDGSPWIAETQSQTAKVVRGSWYNEPEPRRLTSAFRAHSDMNAISTGTGLRIVREVDP